MPGSAWTRNFQETSESLGSLDGSPVISRRSLKEKEDSSELSPKSSGVLQIAFEEHKLKKSPSIDSVTREEEKSSSDTKVSRSPDTLVVLESQEELVDAKDKEIPDIETYEEQRLDKSEDNTSPKSESKKSTSVPSRNVETSDLTKRNRSVPPQKGGTGVEKKKDKKKGLFG